VSTSLQKAIVMELLNVTKAEEGQKKMIFGKPFHYAGSKWVPDKAGPKEETSKERSKKTEDSKKVLGKSVRGERGHIGLRGEKDSIEDLMNCAEKAKSPISLERAKEYYHACLFWSEDPSESRSLQQGSYDGTEERKKRVEKDTKRMEQLFEFYPVYKEGTSKIYRGIILDPDEGWSNLQIKLAFQKGNMIDMKGLSSWSSDPNVARNFAANSSGRPWREYLHVTFESTNKKGISLKSMSQSPRESEVLHSSKTKWKVKNTEDLGNNHFKIQLEEQ